MAYYIITTRSDAEWLGLGDYRVPLYFKMGFDSAKFVLQSRGSLKVARLNTILAQMMSAYIVDIEEFVKIAADQDIQILRNQELERNFHLAWNQTKSEFAKNEVVVGTARIHARHVEERNPRAIGQMGVSRDDYSLLAPIVAKSELSDDEAAIALKILQKVMIINPTDDISHLDVTFRMMDNKDLTMIWNAGQIILKLNGKHLLQWDAEGEKWQSVSFTPNTKLHQAGDKWTMESKFKSKLPVTTIQVMTPEISHDSKIETMRIAHIDPASEDGELLMTSNHPELEFKMRRDKSIGIYMKNKRRYL